MRVVGWRGCSGAHKSGGCAEAEPGCRAHGGAGQRLLGELGVPVSSPHQGLVWFGRCQGAREGSRAGGTWLDGH